MTDQKTLSVFRENVRYETSLPGHCKWFDMCSFILGPAEVPTDTNPIVSPIAIVRRSQRLAILFRVNRARMQRLKIENGIRGISTWRTDRLCRQQEATQRFEGFCRDAIATSRYTKFPGKWNLSSVLETMLNVRVNDTFWPRACFPEVPLELAGNNSRDSLLRWLDLPRGYFSDLLIYNWQFITSDWRKATSVRANRMETWKY